MSAPSFNAIKQYIAQFHREQDPFFQEMVEYATLHSVPIMEKDGLETMLHYFRFIQPQKILEVGTAIGYSALKMIDTCPNSHIYTVERDVGRVEEAKNFIAQKNASKQITILVGDALEITEEIVQYGPFDIVFIDAAKGQYKKFFDLFSPHLNSGGFIFSDNVLFKGLVAGANSDVNTKRIEKMITKIQDYNFWLHSHPSFDTILLPVGDGLAVSRKKD